MIDGVGRAQAPRPIAGVSEAAGRTTAAGAGARSGDVVAAKTVAQEPATSNLARIAKDLAASPPVDTARVEALRMAIASGDYKPDPARIAEKMIALESPGRSLAGPKPQD